MLIGAALFALVVPFVLWYYSMVLMNALWEGMRKAGKEAVEVLIDLERIKCEMEENYT